jgi:hypothetical protein
MKNLENNLDKALDMFINEMRLFISTELKREYGNDWEKIYFETLHDQQKKNWESNRDIKNRITLIDFGNLFRFSMKTRFFYQFVDRGAGDIPSKFNDINQARNMRAHYQDFDQDKSDLAYAQMLFIAKKLDMCELENNIRQLKDGLFKKDKLNTENTNSPKHIKPKRIIEYTSARLTFKKDEIESLRDHNIIRIHVTNDSTTYEMTKKDFYTVFSNVVSSKSYTEIGNYNYKKTPQKALQFMVC